MAQLSASQLRQVKDLIFTQGRLLERQLFRYVFEAGDRAACLKALVAYQNPDGGFGNGIEPDLLCPGSSAIGAETALFVLDLLGALTDAAGAVVIRPLLDWLATHQTASGAIRHPPPGLTEYPHQPWWAGHDDHRVLAIAAHLKAWQSTKPEVFAQARQFYDQMPRLETYEFYHYPLFVYLAAHQQTAADKAHFAALLTHLPQLLEDNADHFPLLGRYWYPLKDWVEPAIVDQAAARVIATVQQQGSLPNPYPDLPWWTPMFTLDALILLKRWSYL